MYLSMSLGNSHVSSALSHARLVSVDLARIIRHYNPDELPSDTINVAEEIYNHKMRRLVGQTYDICLGNDVREQGQCTTL